MGPSRKEVKYLMEHDPEYAAMAQGKKVGQLADALTEGGGDDKMVPEEPTGPSNEEISMQMWERMEENYEKMERGEAVKFGKDPLSSFSMREQKGEGAGSKVKPES